MLLVTLESCEAPTLIIKALWVLTNILNDEKDFMIQIVSDSECGTLFRKAMELLVHSNDCQVHSNALLSLTGFILTGKEKAPELVHRIERENPLLLEGLLKRGLKSLSSNYDSLRNSLFSIELLIDLDQGNKELKIDD